MPPRKGSCFCTTQRSGCSVVAGLFRRKVASFSHAAKSRPAGENSAICRPLRVGNETLKTCAPSRPRAVPLSMERKWPRIPVPALEVMTSSTRPQLQLRLSPEAGTVGRRQPDAGVEVGELELAVIANQVDPGLVVGVFAEIVIRLKFKPDLLGAGHFVGRSRTRASFLRRSRRRIRPGLDTSRRLGVGERRPGKQQQE